MALFGNHCKERKTNCGWFICLCKCIACGGGEQREDMLGRENARMNSQLTVLRSANMALAEERDNAKSEMNIWIENAQRFDRARIKVEKERDDLKHDIEMEYSFHDDTRNALKRFIENAKTMPEGKTGDVNWPMLIEEGEKTLPKDKNAS